MKKVISIIIILFILSSVVLGSLNLIKNKNELSNIKFDENSSLAILVYDGTGYKQQSAVPIGNYRLNSDKTKCLAGGFISAYDSTTGNLTYSLQSDDRCFVYFDPKQTPTFTVSSSSITKDIKSGTTQQITYTYNGNGTVSCSPGVGSYSSCSIFGNTITFTYKAVGSENFTIIASETDTYMSATKIVTVAWTCLDEETLVAYWDRKKKKKLKKKIKDFKEGDIVYSFDEKLGQFVTRRVKKLIETKTKEIYHIFVNGEDIKTTASHPFYVSGAGYLDASIIKAGCELIGADGEKKTVEKVEIETLKKEKSMYCLELEDGGSSFAVGTTGIICLAMFVDGMALLLSPSTLDTVVAIAYSGL